MLASVRYCVQWEAQGGQAMRIELEQIIKDYTDKLSAVRWRHGSELQRATAAGTIA
eukprot:SAG31_NODE_8996_length_1350_cov_1.617906_2_plen_55_part_01